MSAAGAALADCFAGPERVPDDKLAALCRNDEGFLPLLAAYVADLQRDADTSASYGAVILAIDWADAHDAGARLAEVLDCRRGPSAAATLKYYLAMENIVLPPHP